jgi:hypothetical protein
MDDRAHRADALGAEADALFAQGRLAEAAARYQDAVALVPTLPRLQNFGSVRQLVGDYEGAAAIFRQAIALDPGYVRARASLGLVLLAQGRLAEGFPLFDNWRQIPELAGKAAPMLEIPRWSGEPVAGKNIMIWGEEGYGDQIMFARFARMLQDEGAQVGWACHRNLVRLVREGLGMEAIAMGGELKIVGADFVAPTSWLPVVCMQRLVAPPPAPYLASPPPNRIEGLRIGVVTRGNPEHGNDRNRSLPPEAAAELMALPGAVSLAPDDTGARDFWDTAGVVAGLDLVISVDTSVAHLAGALGRPVWVMTPAIGCDWRWATRESAAAWYPSARLFRQTTPSDWSGVLAEVKVALEAL